MTGQLKRCILTGMVCPQDHALTRNEQIIGLIKEKLWPRVLVDHLKKETHEMRAVYPAMPHRLPLPSRILADAVTVLAQVRYTHNYQEAEHSVFVPASLPGENIIVQPLSISKQGIKARILELNSTAPSRQTPQCNAFPACGGCSFQHWAPAEIETWKHQLLATHLERAHVSTASIRPALTSPAKSRRRASFHIKRLADTAVVGFHERMGTHIIDPDGCTIIDPRLASLKTALVEFSLAHLPIGATLEAQANLLAKEDGAPHTGLCLYLQNKAAKPLWTAEPTARIMWVGGNPAACQIIN